MIRNITEYAPHHQLSPFIRSYWTASFGGPNTISRFSVLPSAYCEWIIHRSDATCLVDNVVQPESIHIGGMPTAFTVEFEDVVTVVGIRFFSQGLHSILGCTARDLVGAVLVPQDIDRSVFTSVQRLVSTRTVTVEKMVNGLDQIFLNRLGKNRHRYNSVPALEHELRRRGKNLAAKEIGDVTFRSQRQSERLFKDATGWTPIRFSRLCRFQKAVAMLTSSRDTSLAATAIDCGYSDQAHMTREFRDLAGVPPLQFLKNRDSFLVIR